MSRVHPWAAVVLSLCTQVLAEQPGAAQPVVKVNGVAPAPVELSIRQMAQLSSRTVSVAAHQAPVAHYQCVRLSDVLILAGIPMGPEVRGQRLTESIRVSARDGYQVTFALAELEPDFRDNPSVLCYQKDGAAIALAEGPFRLIVPDDKKHGRWVRQVDALTWMR